MPSPATSITSHLPDCSAERGTNVLWPPPRRVLRSGVPSARLGRVADEAEQCLVDLVGVGPDDRMRPTGNDDRAGVLQQRGEPPAGGLVGQDAILVSVDDQDGDADRGEIAPEVFPSAEVEPAEQDMQFGGQRVEVISGAWPT